MKKQPFHYYKMSTSVNSQMAAANPYMVVGGITGGAVPPELTKESLRARHTQVENQIAGMGIGERMINTRVDRTRRLESLLAENNLQEASAFIDRIAGLIPLVAGRRKTLKRSYRRKQTRKNKKHGKKV